MKAAWFHFLSDLRSAVRQPLAQGVAVLLGFLTLAVTALVARQGQLRDAARLEQDAGLLAAMVKLRFDSHRDGLIALRVALERGASHDWQTFSNQVETLYPWLNFPAFTEFAFLHRIEENNRTNFTKVVREHAHTPFELRFPAGRPEFWISFPILFHHFVRQHDQPAPDVFTQWGLDVNQDATERDRLTWSWASDRPGTTRGGNSVWGPAPTSHIRVYLPVLSPAPAGDELQDQWQAVQKHVRQKYETELPPENLTEAARSAGKLARLRGMLMGRLDVAKLLSVSFPSNAPALAVRIRDESGDTLAGALPANPYLTTTRKERYYGRDWHFDFSTTTAWELTSLRWWAAGVLSLGGGASLAAGVTVGFWCLGRDRDQVARRVAEQQSAELARARDALHAVQAARAQLQRNLHDAVLQRLYAAALHARRTWQTAGRGEPVAAEELGVQVGELDAAMTELRTFLSGPSHRELTGPELGSALRGLAQAFARQTGVTVTVEAAAEALAELPPGAGEHLLQMVREGLSNAWRHGLARQVRVRLAATTGALTLEVEDDGIGFDPAAPRRGGQGLRNLAERAALCGGTLALDTRIGGPTTLRVALPTGLPAEVLGTISPAP
jgi:signal transduction histidine kinase